MAKIDTPMISQWVSKHSHLVPSGATVLDLACGAGRHTRYFLDRGNRVIAVDRDISRLTELSGHPCCEIISCDLESAMNETKHPKDGLPFEHCELQCMVVVNYLHRPLYRALAESLSTGGILIYQTFMEGNAEFGRPTNPDFLLKPGELAATFNSDFAQIDFFEGFISNPRPAMIQCYCGQKR